MTAPTPTLRDRVALTDEQRKLARHALGLPNINRASYRNRFFVAQGAPAHALWESMVAAGFAGVERSKSRSGDGFYLTPTGAGAALDDGERLDREDFPTAPSVPRSNGEG